MKKMYLIFIAVFSLSIANAQDTITISANPPTGGVVNGSGVYNLNQTCYLHEWANYGYSFVSWTENGNIISPDSNYSFTVTNNRNIVANFDTVPSLLFTVVTSANPTTGGTITGGGTFLYGQVCNLKAFSDTGYVFANWTENGSIISFDSSITFYVYTNRNIVANFTTNPYIITTSSNPPNAGVVYGGGTFILNQTCTLGVSANTGFAFVNWTENGTVIFINDSIFTFTVTTNRDIVANFDTILPTQYTITTSANPTTGGYITGGGTYTDNQICHLNAIADNGYVFVNWTENGYIVSTDSVYTFNVYDNMSIVANFATIPYIVTTSSNPTNGGYTNGGGTYANQICHVSAYPYSPYSFINWTENGNIVSTDSIYSFTVTASINLVANFSILTGCSAQFTMVADTTTPHHYYAVNNATGIPPIQYVWSWGDGTANDSTAYPSHTYSAAGYYNICLTITDSTGCTNTYCDSSYLQKSPNSIISVSVIPQGTLGINTEVLSHQIKIYPNPAKEILTIETNLNTEQRIEIINLLGQTVYTTYIYNKATINTSAFPSGVYILKLYTDKETVVKKFVKE